jgi:ElaB/YqjD/DUF883 family membrane-anchored ribosome-binding protein
MERNDAGTDGLARGGQIEPNEFSASANTQEQPQDGQTGFAGGSDQTGQSQGFRDRARNALGTAGERLADVGSGAREKVGNAKDKLATALEAGADRLRERSQAGGAALAGATAAGSTPVQAEGKVAEVSDRVAGGMQATADWLRDADIDGLKTGIENQVKEHPGRTLLIAAGLGYLIGRAFRKP